ncbi:hypothetical protein [Streptomyces sp. NPDC088746]|uniref:hypothetical protein n=1 Tax=Streptomyces sp. NPDC088746 TaxID=3365885 RepID=UPI0037FC8106
MSVIVEFFAAPDDASAALALRTGPRAFASLSFGNFDPEEAVVEWECLLAGGSVEELVEADEPRLVAGQDDDDGCVVFAISPRLSTALAEAERSELQDAAAAWSLQRAEDGELIDTEIAEVILCDLAALVSSARLQGRGVYCWVA